MNTRVLALWTILALAALPSFSQPAYQVDDINPGESAEHGIISALQKFATIGTTVYFLADDGIHGLELWKSDATAPGTVLVKDVCPGACAASPNALTAHGGLVYFTADDGVHGREMWKTDGTEAGTVLVKDVRPGLADGAAGRVNMVLGGFLYFPGDDGLSGLELWRTDGTEAGTQLVADIRPGTAGSGPSLRAVGSGLLLLAADDGVHGLEPWVSNGIGAGTALLKDIRPGTASSAEPERMDQISDINIVLREWAAAPWGGFLFVARDATHGHELWITDGTEANTSLLLDIYPGSNGSQPSQLTDFGGLVYFSAGDLHHGFQLWRTDGTAANTTRVSGIENGPTGGLPSDLTVVGGNLFFQARDLGHGGELWITDGTPGGEHLVKDLLPGNGSSFTWDHPHGFTNLGGQLVFFARKANQHSQIWRSDGTEAGTVVVADLDGLTHPSSIYLAGTWAVAGDRIFFDGFDGSHELWVTDGTALGTAPLKDLQTQTSSTDVWLGRLLIGGPWGAFGSKSLFPSYDGVVRSAWVSDGTAAGTFPLSEGTHYPQVPREFTQFGALSLFAASDGLWRTDGTLAGTHLVSYDPTGHVSDLTPYGPWMLFSWNRGISLPSLWRSDGTEAGTDSVRSIGASGGNVAEITVSGAFAYFRATDASGYELWKTDATFSGTSLVLDIRPAGSSSTPTGLADLGGLLLFSAETDAAGRELWKSNGLDVGTVLVKDIRAGAASSIRTTDERGVLLRAVAGSYYYFVADDGASGEELWRSDGTEAGTIPVKDIYPGARGSEPRWLTTVGSRLFFVAGDDINGRELWVTDGTEANTHLVADLVPGLGSPVPQNLTAVDGLLLFTAWDENHGTELWKSDGTVTGTALVQDISAGPTPSSPLEITVAGPWIYFAANDGDTGFEPWILPRTALGTGVDFYTVEPCRIADTRLAGGALNGGTPRTIAAAGTCGIPADAVALAVNLTVISPTGGGTLVVHASGIPTPDTLNVGFSTGQTRSNNALVTLGPGGIEALADMTGQTHLVVDVTGYFK
jgi:large repetitive protein